MKVAKFDAPGNNGDLAGNPTLADRWSQQISGYFDTGVQHVRQRLSSHPAAVSQFYNPLTHGSTAPDLPLSQTTITWNGFPRKFLPAAPGQPVDFAATEPTPAAGNFRPQDEYLEWHVTRQNGKITSIQFTSEGYDYYQFLAAKAPNILLALYQRFISPNVVIGDLIKNGQYDTTNKWNTEFGAMHLTQGANNLFAEVILGAEATVRRKDTAGHEITSAIPLTRCSQFGDDRRNSDPNIGAGVNHLAGQNRMITIADPVGLYIDSLDDSTFRLPNNAPTTGWFKVLRGSAGHTIRAVFEPPAGSPFTVSDVKIGNAGVTFGGQIAQFITMKLTGVAGVAQTTHNPLIACVGAGGAPIMLAAIDPPAAHTASESPLLPLRGREE
ncbi:hypothetical protein [uncultured Paludibaculum sp.]|uniref:hypothetical protein n=1 Tax=uncultured Paludibaculum sp. TaxID=1765020 RepID=UPI002AAA986C|nr:hypothetical protein [uncultured Paludibaculum sp.]